MTKPVTLFELAAADPEVRFSPHCWKVRYALAHKQVDAERVPWRFTDKDAISFSGQGLVPVLVHGDDVLTDSWRIANFLETQYPDHPALFGDAAQPLAEFINAWADGALLPRIARIILVNIHDNLADKDKPYFRQSREKRFGAPLEEVASNRPELLKDLGAALAPLRGVLKSRPFLAGEEPRYADYSVLGMFIWARCVSEIELLQPDDPVHHWRDRLLDIFGGLGRKAPSIVARATA
jgi:glutathione S-transferase